MQHTALRVILITALKVVLRVHGHVAGRYLDVLVVRDIHTCGIVHLVIGSCGDRERGNGTLPVIEDGIHIWREYALVGIIHLHGGVGPPEEGLRQRGTIAQPTAYFQIGTAGTQREAHEALLVKHTFHLVAPHGDASVLFLFDFVIYRQEGARAVMLGPVELDAAADPRPCQSYKCRFYDVVVIDEVALLHLVVGHLNATSQLRQYHHFDVFVLQPYGQVCLVGLLIGNRFNDGIWIHHATTALIDPVFQEDRILLRFSGLVSGNHHLFAPCFNHIF